MYFFRKSTKNSPTDAFACDEPSNAGSGDYSRGRTRRPFRLRF